MKTLTVVQIIILSLLTQTHYAYAGNKYPQRDREAEFVVMDANEKRVGLFAFMGPAEWGGPKKAAVLVQGRLTDGTKQLSSPV